MDAVSRVSFVSTWNEYISGVCMAVCQLIGHSPWPNFTLYPSNITIGDEGKT